jgi:WD40 repeat protein
VLTAAHGSHSPEQVPAEDLANSVVHLKHDGRVRACCSLDASTCLATASGGNVHYWDGAVASGHDVSVDQSLRTISLEHILGEVQTLSRTAASSDGTQVPILAAGTAPKKQARRSSSGVTCTTAAGTIAMLDPRISGSTVGALIGHTNTVWQVQYSSDRPQLACSASADGNAKVWDIRTQQVLHTVCGGHRGGIRCCTFVCGGQQQGQLSIVTGGFDTTIRVHNCGVPTSTEVAGCGTDSDRKPPSRVLARLHGYCFGLDATERWIVAGAGNPDYGVRLWGPWEALPHELNCAQKLLGKFFRRSLLPCNCLTR